MVEAGMFDFCCVQHERPGRVLPHTGTVGAIARGAGRSFVYDPGLSLRTKDSSPERKGSHWRGPAAEMVQAGETLFWIRARKCGSRRPLKKLN